MSTRKTILAIAISNLTTALLVVLLMQISAALAADRELPAAPAPARWQPAAMQSAQSMRVYTTTIPAAAFGDSLEMIAWLGSPTYPTRLSAPVNLPHGATIQQMTAWIDDTETNRYVEVSLGLAGLDNPYLFWEAMKGSTSGVPSNWNYKLVVTSEWNNCSTWLGVDCLLVDTNRFQYWAAIEAKDSSGTVGVRGVQICYTLPDYAQYLPAVMKNG